VCLQAITFAALQCQIRFGSYDQSRSAQLKLAEYLPAEYAPMSDTPAETRLVRSLEVSDVVG
jgi:hypothetical protein